MSLDDFSEEGEYPEFAIEMAVTALEEDGISLTDTNHSEKAPEGSEAGAEPKDMKVPDNAMSEKQEEEYFANIGM